MDKLREFGRKAFFYVRVLSGYEERRIRSYRLEIQRRIAEAEQRKAAIRKIPEQVILSEVRRMVEEMKALNKKLEDTEAEIEEYFKPLDKEAQIIMETQLQAEEKTVKQMMQAVQTQALLENAEAEKMANTQNAEINQHIPEKAPSSSSQAAAR